MISLKDFISNWIGKEIDFDGYYGAQCMDLMHQYNVEVLGITDGRVLAQPSAKLVYSNFDNVPGHELFTRIENTPSAIPEPGDIVVWKFGKYGHIAICVKADINKFTSFDLNFPIGANCQLVIHDYSEVSGWLRFIPTVNPKDLKIEALEKEKDDLEKKLKIANIEIKSLKSIVKALKDTVTELTYRLGNWQELLVYMNLGVDAKFNDATNWILSREKTKDDTIINLQKAQQREKGVHDNLKAKYNLLVKTNQVLISNFSVPELLNELVLRFSGLFKTLWQTWNTQLGKK